MCADVTCARSSGLGAPGYTLLDAVRVCICLFEKAAHDIFRFSKDSGAKTSKETTSMSGSKGWNFEKVRH